MKLFSRTISEQIRRDCASKIVLLCGPRQSGKTTLAKNLVDSFDYLNFDVQEDRARLLKRDWNREKKLIIFDEIHKMKNWKSWLKGLYDSKKEPSILVTGSSRLDLMKKGGDSLAGRHHLAYLLPFDIKELHQQLPSQEAFRRITHFSGFPEPLLKNSAKDYQRWRNAHQEVILRQDLISSENIREIETILTLRTLLQGRVGSAISYLSLARDLQVDPKTVKKYIGILENLFVGFTVHPFHKNIARSILKEPKFYFFDQGCVEGDQGAKLENLVAISLYKEMLNRRYLEGENYSLHYLRTKDGREVDFAIAKNQQIKTLIEVKSSDTNFSEHFSHFSQFLPKQARLLQLVHQAKEAKSNEHGWKLYPMLTWLESMDF